MYPSKHKQSSRIQSRRLLNSFLSLALLIGVFPLTNVSATAASATEQTTSSKSAAKGAARAQAATSQSKVEVHPPKSITSSSSSSSPVGSASGTKLAAEAWRKSAPTVPPPRPFKLPVVTQVKLENGLNIQMVEDHRVPFVTMALGIKAGTALEPKEKLGLADLTTDMLTEGTTSKSSKEIANEIDFIGGGLKAISDYDYAVVSASALSNYQDRLLKMLTDVTLHPSFTEAELKLKKTNLLQTLTMKRSEPNFLVEERFNDIVYGQHPYAVIAPTPETVSRITTADLREFHDKHYFPNQSTLVVIGDFDSTKMKAAIAQQLGAEEWKSGELAVTNMPPFPKQSGRRIYLVDRPGSVQTSLKIGNVGIKKTDADYFPMTVMNQILGGAAHSRLFLNIREQKGYTYGAYSSVTARKQAGPFAAEAEVRTDVTGPSLEEFLYELDRIRNTKVSDKELADAKAYLVGSFQLGLETQAGLAQRLLEENLFDLPGDYLETYTNKLMAVSVDDVRRVARRLIDNGNLTIAAVGDASKIKSELELFGPVEVYDTNGKLSNQSIKSSESIKGSNQPGS